MLIKSKRNYLSYRNCSKPSLSLSNVTLFMVNTEHFDIIWDKYLHTTHYFPQLLGENYGLCNIYSLRTFDQKSSRLMHCLHCTCSMFAWLPSSSPPSFPHPFLDDYCCSRHHCLPPHNIGSEPSKSKSKTKWRPMKDEGELCRLFEDWWFLPLSMMIPSGRKGLRGGRVKRWIDFLWIVRCAAIFSSTCGYSHFTWREAKLLNTNSQT